MKSLYSKIERLKQFVVFFFEKYQPVCGLCGGKLSWKSFFPVLSGKDRDSFALHHKNHNRKDERPKNKAIVHRSCHRRHHREMQIKKEKGMIRIKYKTFENVNGKIIEKNIVVLSSMI